MKKVSLFKKYLKSEDLVGVPPDQITTLKSDGREFFIIHKSAKKGKISFLLTKALCDNLWATALKIQKQPKLIISIPVGKDEYIFTGTLTKKEI